MLIFGSFCSIYRHPDIGRLNGNVLEEVAICAIMLAMISDVSLSLDGAVG